MSVETCRFAEGYTRRGLAVVPVPERRKNPAFRSWQNLRIGPKNVGQYFDGRPQNIGVLLGEPSGWIVDVDCDVPEAVACAPYFLLETVKSGRGNAPRTHWWYRSEGICTEKFRDLDGVMVLELRSTGCQTLVAPSMHPDGDRYAWEPGTREFVEMSAEDLLRCCKLVATAALVARHLPPVGGRHDFGLALAGFLLREGRLSEEEALRVMEAAWAAEGATRDAQRDLRGIVRDTARNLSAGREAVGGRRLDELSPGLPRVLGRWWGWPTREERPGREETTAPAAKEAPLRPFVAFSSAAELMRKELQPVRWVVPAILPEGVTLLAGKPKLGKSWLALGLCVAVAAGGAALGNVPIERGAALYLALEDNERRLQARLRKILAGPEAPAGLDYATLCPRLNEGGLEAIAGWLEIRPDARLVVLDTLAKIRPRAAGRNVYQEDYEALEALLPLAAEHNAAILVVHHLRKQGASDPLDEVNSSIGLTGGVDGALILKRDRTRADASLFVTGRDVEEEKDLALSWSAKVGTWTLVGDAEEYRASQERQAVAEYLRSVDGTASPSEIAKKLGKNVSTVRNLLSKMARAGQVEVVSYGQYAATERKESTEQSTSDTHPLQEEST